MAAKKTAAKKTAAKGLTLKQHVFVLEYCGNGFNGTKAAEAAGFSAKTAGSQASRMLKNVKVRAAISERCGKALAKREITAERVLDELAKLAFFDPRRLFNEFGSLRPITELGDDEAAAIAGMDVSELYEDGDNVGQMKKIKLADKGTNLERLGRHLKLFKEGPEGTKEDPFHVSFKSILSGDL